jgi:5'-nucleotidase
MNFIVLLDMDGVVCDYNARILELAHTRLGLPLFHPEEVKEFSPERVFEEEHQKAVDALSNEEGFYASLPPITDAIESIKEMRRFMNGKFGEVIVCTAPKKPSKNPFCTKEKLEWLAKHLGDDFANNAIISRDKTLVRGSVLIDDKPVVSGALTPVWEHVHFAHAYNEGLYLPRITSWPTWHKVIIPMFKDYFEYAERTREITPGTFVGFDRFPRGILH